jgi:hypothetical protein
MSSDLPSVEVLTELDTIFAEHVDIGGDMTVEEFKAMFAWIERGIPEIVVMKDAHEFLERFTRRDQTG